MDVLFVHDNGFVESLGVCEISALLKHHGFSVDLMLLSHETDPFQRIHKDKPRVVAFSCMTGYHNNVVAFARALKEEFPSIFTIMGGPHPTYYPKIIDRVPALDAICVGEGELAMLDLVRALSSGQSCRHIANLHVRADGRVERNSLRPLIEDLDAFPLPDRALYYDSYGFLAGVTMKRFITGRGCPYQCTFCFNEQYNSMYRKRGSVMRRKSVGRVIAEVDEVRSRWALASLHFSDDIFVMGDAWLEEFCAKYGKSVNIPFTLNLCFDQLTERRTRLLAEAGCAGCAVGLESGNEELRNFILGKRLKKTGILRGADLLRSHGLKIMTTNMTGLPGETEADAIGTLELNLRIRSDFGRTYFFWPFPGTELTNRAVADGLLPASIDYDTFGVHHAWIADTPRGLRLKRNVANVFSFVIMFPWTWPYLKQCMRLPPAVTKVFQVFTVCADVGFYRPKLISGMRYFINCAPGILSGNLFRMNERMVAKVYGVGRRFVSALAGAIGCIRSLVRPHRTKRVRPASAAGSLLGGCP